MELPQIPFYLFGMGARRKLIYREGTLTDARTGEQLGTWNVQSTRIQASEYSVTLITDHDKPVIIGEDEHGIWLDEDGERRVLSEGPVKLPDFAGNPHQNLLRILHHEILLNVVDGLPVPNFMVYDKPWYRDAAMMCMCLERTGNLDLVTSWIEGLREPFDRNNAGHNEPDNLGQLLYMISLVSDASHPLVDVVLQAITPFQRDQHIVGLSDFAEHPVYQTKWLKYGLRSLGLDDPFVIPEVYDSYSVLFWMDYRDQHVPGAGFTPRLNDLYPYLGWAEAHFHGWPLPLPLLGNTFPLTWEAEASQAQYPGMARVDEQYVARRICAPHTWHAAEAMLYLAS